MKICVAAPAYVGSDLAHQRDQCRWFGGMVGNHVADIVARYGAGGANVPAALTDYIAGRHGLRLQRARPHRESARRLRAGHDRRPVLHPGPGCRAHRAVSPSCKALGVDQFAVYLQHDAKESTLKAYEDVVIPALRDAALAKT